MPLVDELRISFVDKAVLVCSCMYQHKKVIVPSLYLASVIIIQVACFDWDQDSADDLIGSCTFTLGALRSGALPLNVSRILITRIWC